MGRLKICIYQYSLIQLQFFPSFLLITKVYKPIFFIYLFLFFPFIFKGMKCRDSTPQFSSNSITLESSSSPGTNNFVYNIMYSTVISELLKNISMYCLKSYIKSLSSPMLRTLFFMNYIMLQLI